MRKTLLLVLVVCALSIRVIAQPAIESKTFTVPKGAIVDVSALTTDWQPKLQSAEMPDAEIDQAQLLAAKKLIAEKYPAGRGSYLKGTELLKHGAGPYMLRNFQGNIHGNFVPNDNNFAISNGNKLITTINSNIYMYDVDAGTLLKSLSLTTFTNSLGLLQTKFDPKAIYDPDADRFIVVLLNGSTYSTSKIVIAFSTSNDPTSTWNLYALNGNPLNDSTYTDYPAISITQGELFITGNAIIPGQPWQTGFKQTYIWQVDKQAGYNGSPLLGARLWTNISFDSKPVRYLCPVVGGSYPYGPNAYFLSNKNFGIQTDSLFLVEVTGLKNDTNTAVHVTHFSTDVTYGMPPNGRQVAGQPPLATNDARILGAFIENARIQYVQNTIDTVTGFAAVYHGVIDNITSAPFATGRIIGDNLLDFGYPNISYAGTLASDNTAIISFNYTSPTTFSGCTAMSFDGAGNYSVNTNLKTGLGYVNVLHAATERWGDYSGSQRKFNEPGKVWTALSFGRSDHYNGTWIAELSLTAPTIVASLQPTALHGLVFPNPVKDILSVSFNNPSLQRLFFEVYDSQGRLVQVLLDDEIAEGENAFSFSTSPLAKGVYSFRIRTGSKAIFSKKVIKAE